MPPRRLEFWRQHPVFRLYEVSTEGRVRHIRTKNVRTPQPNKFGYLRVSIPMYSNSLRYNVPVAQLVLEAFVGPRPPGMQIRHLKGNKQDNRLRRLAWGTPQENYQDRMDQNRYTGPEHHNYKLTDDQIRAIRDDPRSQRIIAREHGIQQTYVGRIKKRIVRWRA
jgi:hypothetical protein